MPTRKLTAEQVIEGAVALADRIGTDALTIRRIAAEIEVKPMSIYHHVPSKDAIIDGMVDAIFARIALPPTDLDWREAIRVRCLSAREVLNRHPWAPPLMESRTSPGPATLLHHEAVLACFRNGGLSLQLAAHAYAVIDSFLYGFTMQEANLPTVDAAAAGRVLRRAAPLPVSRDPAGMVEVLLVASSHFSGIADARMKSFRLLSAAVR